MVLLLVYALGCVCWRELRPNNLWTKIHLTLLYLIVISFLMNILLDPGTGAPRQIRTPGAPGHSLTLAQG